MAMTPQEMLDFFAGQAGQLPRHFRAAVEARNHYLAASNLHQLLKALVMQGLIGWRTGLAASAHPFREAVRQLDEGRDLLASIPPDILADVPLEKLALIAYLVDAPLPTVAASNLKADRLLDAVLGAGVVGAWNQSAWSEGMAQLERQKKAALALESYALYRELLHAEAARVDALVERATALFSKRAKDGFFRGGDQTEGGGPDNAVTVDYRLAAVMKRIGYAGESGHRWRG